MTALSALIETSTDAMFGGNAVVTPTERARQLDRDLQQFRTTAKPILAGVIGVAGRRSIQRGLQLFTACDHFGRTLDRDGERHQDAADCPELADAFASVAAQTRRNIDALVAAIDGVHAPTIASATDELDARRILSAVPARGFAIAPDRPYPRGLPDRIGGFVDGYRRRTTRGRRRHRRDRVGPICADGVLLGNRIPARGDDDRVDLGVEDHQPRAGPATGFGHRPVGEGLEDLRRNRLFRLPPNVPFRQICA